MLTLINGPCDGYRISAKELTSKNEVLVRFSVRKVHIGKRQYLHFVNIETECKRGTQMVKYRLEVDGRLHYQNPKHIEAV